MDTIDALGPPLSEVSQLHLIGRAALQFAGDLGRANDFLDGEEDRLALHDGGASGHCHGRVAAGGA